MAIMKNKTPIASTKYKDMQFFWVTEHYDVHLMGYCIHENKYCYFFIDASPFGMPIANVIYDIYSLNLFEKIRMLINKNMFELCVSKAWSYPKEIETIKPVWLSKLLHDFYYWVWIK